MTSPDAPPVIRIEAVRPGSPDADRIVREYLTEVASRWFGRPATPAEVDQALEDEAYDDLDGETGVLLVAVDAGEPVGCAGARFLTTPSATAELTKVFTSPTHRGTGVGSRLIRAVEQLCTDRRIRTLQLDTRAELAEACALYERLGFTRVEPFTVDPHSDRWYRKTLSPSPLSPV